MKRSLFAALLVLLCVATSAVNAIKCSMCSKLADVEPRSDAAAAAFMAWLEENEVKMDGVMVARVDKGSQREEWGLVATRDFGEDESVQIRVPAALILGYRPSNVLDSPSNDLEELILKYSLSLSPETRLVLSLFREKARSKSRFLPYLLMLPQSYPHSTLAWTSEEVSRLAGTDTYSKHLSVTAALEAARSNVTSILRTQPDVLTGTDDPSSAVQVAELVDWAFHTVISRGVHWEGGIVLAPLIDMINHGVKDDLPCGGLKVGLDLADKSAGAVTFVSNNRFKAGDEVVRIYLMTPTLGFPVLYGFVPSDHLGDAITLSLDLKDDGSFHFFDKISLLNGQGFNNESAVILYGSDKGLPCDLLMIVRVLKLVGSTDLVRAHMRASDPDQSLCGAALTLANEEAAMAEILRLLELRLRLYPSRPTGGEEEEEKKKSKEVMMEGKEEEEEEAQGLMGVVPPCDTVATTTATASPSTSQLHLSWARELVEREKLILDHFRRLVLSHWDRTLAEATAYFEGQA